MFNLIQVLKSLSLRWNENLRILFKHFGRKIDSLLAPALVLDSVLQFPPLLRLYFTSKSSRLLLNLDSIFPLMILWQKVIVLKNERYLKGSSWYHDRIFFCWSRFKLFKWILNRLNKQKLNIFSMRTKVVVTLNSKYSIRARAYRKG